MEIQPKLPTSTGDPAFFVGEVFIDRIATDPGRVRANLVRFTPGARNSWHRHIHGQTLHVVDGIGLVQSRGEATTVIRAGDTIWTPPDEWHWHGAAPDHFMAHLAIWEGPAEGESRPETEWGDRVSDDEYGYPPPSRPAE
jgi:quercetin dioxygenase-like cupin family protein